MFEINMITYSTEDNPDVFMEIENQCFDKCDAFDKYMYKHFVNNPHFINIVALDGDSPIGSIVAEPSRENTYYIYTIGVIKSHRRCGIATNLLNKIIDMIGDNNSIVLHTRQSNIDAINFYKTNGFIIESIVDGYYVNESAYIMSRKSTYSNT